MWKLTFLITAFGLSGAQAQCGSPNWKGDDWCDDENNNGGCEWDGGDCCPPFVRDNWDNYCNDCQCLDPNEATTTTTTTTAAPAGNCAVQSWKGDDWCDDSNNNAGCDWDGGDCCPPFERENWDNYCTDCKCLDPNGVTTTTTPSTTTQGSDGFECGVADVAGRIVGGGEANPNSIPWQVGIVNAGSNTLRCGGSIITPYHILSAAHCFQTSTLKQVIAGEHDLLSTADKATRHDIAQILNHPNYNHASQTYDFDYSILTLMTPINLGPESHSRAVCLPNAGDITFTSNDVFTVSGWGSLSSGGSFPNKLHHVEVPWVSDAQCQQGYNEAVGNCPCEITDRMICAGNFNDGGIDSCQGDSGGPLTWVDPNTQKVKLIGVVSWGVGCAVATKPGVYAEVTSVLQWVKDNSDHTNPVTGEPVPTGCGNLAYYNDNWCDDSNNNADCNWDGGDCCASTNENPNLHNFCSDAATCKCLDPDA